MPGLSLLTALEIFTNPGDLEMTICQEVKKDGKFAIGIFRGHGHDFKPMLTSQPFAATQEDAVKAIEEILLAVHNSIPREFETQKNCLLPKYLNPDGETIDWSKVLNPDLIRRILEKLRRDQVASTCEMLPVAS